MKLKTVKISDFHSIREIDPVEIGDITCLVGKNEAGKTAFLQALYRLNPIVKGNDTYDVTNDYPRADVEEYRYLVENGDREHATVVEATFSLGAELTQIEGELGAGVLVSPEFQLMKGYDNQLKYSLRVNEDVAVRAIVRSAQLSAALAKDFMKCLSIEDLSEAISNRNEPEVLAQIKDLKQTVGNVLAKGTLEDYIFHRHLSESIPKFLYFDDYYLMKGHENIEALKQRVSTNALLPHDHPLLGLIELARIDLDELVNPARTQELVNRLEGAGNLLSRKVLRYWSQNKNLLMRFDVRPARPNDPEGMRDGTNVWATIYDTKRLVTTILGSRSRGFVWFFSFLAWFDKQQRSRNPLILLLDEPGLYLHGRAQGDLLHYMEKELKDSYQVIYTTHSPFMVDSRRFDRVRIVQDKSMDTTDELPAGEDGTKVTTDILEATEDSLFPLQAALGYDIHQTLFVGPNSLVVEGVSDLLYIQTLSAVLSSRSRTSLSEDWTVTPVGGADKVPTFVALLGAQRGLKIATLIDVQKKDQQVIENLYKRKLLKKQNVLTFADFTGSSEADIEDMLGDDFYLQLVNAEFASVLTKPITLPMVKSKSPRILQRLTDFLDKNPLQNGAHFNHYRPARYLVDNLASLENALPEAALGRFEKAFEALNALL